MKYQEFYNKSIESPELFWEEQSQNLGWYKQPTNILFKDKNDFQLWFADGKLNLGYLYIVRHIKGGFGRQITVIYD
jgi:hypothetical protein